MSTNRWLFRFGDFELDAGGYELRRKGRRLRLARQPMELLLLLVEHPRALVSREEIAKRLWEPGVFIDMDAGIHTAILRIRQVLRDSAEAPRFVETVPGKGYRLSPLSLACRPGPEEALRRSAGASRGNSSEQPSIRAHELRRATASAGRRPQPDGVIAPRFLDWNGWGWRRPGSRCDWRRSWSTNTPMVSG